MVQPLITRALRPGHALPAPLARMYRCTRKDSPQPAPAPAQHAPSQLDHFLTRRPSSPDRCVTAILKPRRPPSPTPSGGSDAALPDAAACCNAPPPFTGHSPCPRAAAARARHRLLFLESALSFLSQYMSKLSPVCRLKCVYSSFRSVVCYTLSALQYPVLLGLLCVTLSALHPCFRQKEGVTPCLEGVVHYTSKRV